eukprot:g4865.t1
MVLSSAASKSVDNAFQLLHMWLVPVPDDITNDLFFSSDFVEQDEAGAEESDSDSEPAEDGDESDDDKEDKFEDDNKLCVVELLPNAILSQSLSLSSSNSSSLENSLISFKFESSTTAFDSSTTAEGVNVLNFGSSRRFLPSYLHSRQVEILEVGGRILLFVLVSALIY